MSLFESDDNIIDRNPSTIVYDWMSKNIIWNFGDINYQFDQKRFIDVIPRGSKFLIKCIEPYTAEFLAPLPDYITIDNNCAIINTIGFIIHSQKDIDAFPSIHRVSNNKDIHDLTFYIKDNSIIFEGGCQFKNVNITSKEGGIIDCRIDSYGYDINNIAELNFIGSDKNTLTFINPGITQKDVVKIPFENKYNDFIRHAKRLNVRYINFAYYLDENPTYIYYELKDDTYVLSTK